MKKILIGVILGVLLVLPAGAFAYGKAQVVSEFKVEHCRAQAEGDTVDYSYCSVSIGKFTDGDNTCYTTYTGRESSSISCVRDEP